MTLVNRSSRKRLSARRLLTGGILAAFATLSIGLAVPASVQAAEPQPQGCGYGTGGPLAETICWLDMAQFDSAQAQTPQGQAMSVDLPGGVTMSFTARLAAGADGLRPLAPAALPTWSGTPIGNSAYVGTPGKPALYQVPGRNGGWLGEVTLDNISVSRNGVPQTAGYAFVMADAESSNKFEGLRFTSTSPIAQIANITPAGYQPACGAKLSGLGTNQVTCMGQGVRNAGDIVTSTESPTRVSIALHNDNDPVGNVNTTRQGMAFGVMFSKVQVTKVVESRYDSTDQFTVSTTEASTGAAIGRATTTGTETGATTGESTILTQVDGTNVTFAEKISGDTGATLDHYRSQWACTRNGNAVPADQLAEGGTAATVTLSVSVGDFVACTVTNTAKLGSVTWNKVDRDSQRLAGSEWALTSPDGTVTTIVDNGAVDENPAVGELSVSGLPWGQYRLEETRAPEGFERMTDVLTWNVDGEHQAVALGDIVNLPSQPPVPSDPPSTPPAVPPTPTVPPTTPPGSPTPTPSTPPGLASTGAEGVLPMVLVGGIALLAGIGLTIRRRAQRG
ncbi:SpaA isopeptide-forming pilin-related protein [Mycetocola lacteus]|uniref:SpaA isopeptide-forming pilin-related protein n=1 Tax=Mycetocola lacteus TaxID=76637 RepID=UPI0011C42649|nr:SpaA isopeptide-forming pilin-related protein [Mycetocola lacteus]